MYICFRLRFAFWVFWSNNHSMTELIKNPWLTSCVLLYTRIKLTLFISHSHIQGFNTCMWRASIETRLQTEHSVVCLLSEARNFLLSQNTLIPWNRNLIHSRTLFEFQIVQVPRQFSPFKIIETGLICSWVPRTRIFKIILTINTLDFKVKY